ncbi:MAG: conjugal transfer protein TraH [Gammaproteobacteria bacterium]|nr:conjugal transfer protein TraH [Gammaproteobacteria bacterium]
MRKMVVGLLVLASTFKVNANDVASELKDFLDNAGYASNVTHPHAYQSQASGYYGGGALYTRTPVKRYNLVTLDMPNYRAGCAGIDLYAGSLSYISGEKLTMLGRSIMQNGGAYAVDVMLATTVPELKQVRDFLQTTVQKVNQANINSCELAQNFVGGVWPKTLASQQKICHDQRMMGGSGGAHDYVAARMECSGEHYQKTMQEAATDNDRKEQVVLGKNLIWEILKKSQFLNDNQELQELVMSLIGTIIISEDGKIKQVPSLARDNDLIHTLLGDVPNLHEAEIWHCTNSKCLDVERKKIVITENQSLTGKVKDMIESINEKIKKDIELSNAEKSFLEMTPLPVLKFLMVLNGTQYGNAAIDMEAYATLIATDLLQKYLSDVLQLVQQYSFNSQIPEHLLKDLRERMEKAQKSIAELDPHINQKLNEKLKLIEQVSKIEKQLSANMQVK